MIYVVRYLPLVTPMARDSMYRTVHPYAARSEKEFRGWNVGKQLAAEVSICLSLQLAIKSAFQFIFWQEYKILVTIKGNPALPSVARV
jgi:hypothetical protein